MILRSEQNRPRSSSATCMHRCCLPDELGETSHGHLPVNEELFTIFCSVKVDYEATTSKKYRYSLRSPALAALQALGI